MSSENRRHGASSVVICFSAIVATMVFHSSSSGGRRTRSVWCAWSIRQRRGPRPRAAAARHAVHELRPAAESAHAGRRARLRHGEPPSLFFCSRFDTARRMSSAVTRTFMNWCRRSSAEAAPTDAPPGCRWPRSRTASTSGRPKTGPHRGTSSSALLQQFDHGCGALVICHVERGHPAASKNVRIGPVRAAAAHRRRRCAAALCRGRYCQPPDATGSPR